MMIITTASLDLLRLIDTFGESQRKQGKNSSFAVIIGARDESQVFDGHERA